MISNTSLSAFSAADLRPTRTPPVEGVRPPEPRTPVQPVAEVRAKNETRPAQELLAPGREPPTTPSGRPLPRGSLLNLSV
jgi:hypothetical protein